MWNVTLQFDSEMDIRWKTDPTGVSSGLSFSFTFIRKSKFLLKSFVLPSVIFVVLAYASFFIDKAAAPARVTLSINNILNAIYLLGSTEKYIPNVPYSTWLTDLITYNLILTIIPLIEFGIVSSSTFIYARKKAEI